LNVPVIIQSLPKEEAVKTGAMALFGEKYGATVRVVTVDPNYSIEFCGGTHVGNTGELGFFVITEETSISSGIRRIFAKAAQPAMEYFHKTYADPTEQNKVLTKRSPTEIPKAIENILTENKELKKAIESVEIKQLNILKDKLLKKIEQVNGVNFIGQIVEINKTEYIKKLRFDLLKEIDGCVVLCSCINNRAEVPIALSDELVSRGLDADNIIKEKIGPLINGSGRGSKNMAAGGGKDCSKFQQVIEIVKSLL
ncbi:MAG: DHHA1 domain-containing protein, partial [Ginsengibacter sp.]